MSESDNFIHEVTEEIRKDRMYRLWTKWGPLVLALIVLAVGGSAVWAWMDLRAAERAEIRGGDLLAADPASFEAQQKLAAQLEPPARLVAEFTAAAALAASGNAGGAAAAYRAIAAKDGLLPVYRDLALLQALRIEAAGGDLAAVQAELAPLMEAGAPYAPLARELSAVLHIRAGDIPAARAELAAILDDAQSTQTLRLRAQELMKVVGGGEPEQAG